MTPALQAEQEAIFRYWKSKGATLRAQRIMAQHGCKNEEDARELGRRTFVAAHPWSPKTILELDRLIGTWDDDKNWLRAARRAARRDLARQIALARAEAPDAPPYKGPME